MLKVRFCYSVAITNFIATEGYKDHNFYFYSDGIHFPSFKTGALEFYYLRNGPGLT